jgi:hypothetical protein
MPSAAVSHSTPLAAHFLRPGRLEARAEAVGKSLSEKVNAHSSPRRSAPRRRRSHTHSHSLQSVAPLHVRLSRASLLSERRDRSARVVARCVIAARRSVRDSTRADGAPGGFCLSKNAGVRAARLRPIVAGAHSPRGGGGAPPCPSHRRRRGGRGAAAGCASLECRTCVQSRQRRAPAPVGLVQRRWRRRPAARCRGRQRRPGLQRADVGAGACEGWAAQT